MLKHLFSKTVLGAAFGAACHIAPDWRNLQRWGEGVGMVWAAYGARSAIAKNGQGV